MLSVGAGTIEDDVGLFQPLAALFVADQQTKGLLAAIDVAGVIFLEQAAPADGQHVAFVMDAALERLALCQGRQIGGDVFAAGDTGIITGEVVLGELKHFTGEGSEQEDDVTLVTLQRMLICRDERPASNNRISSRNRPSPVLPATSNGSWQG